MAKDQLSFPYWHAVAFGRENHVSVLKAIGEKQAEVTSDSRIFAETRSELAERLVFASLFELWSGWPAAVPHAAVQQMLRSVDEEVQAAVAHVPERFVKGRLDKGNAASG
jgi:hypothetical protein